jgi:hypothetical protein
MEPMHSSLRAGKQATIPGAGGAAILCAAAVDTVGCHQYELYISNRAGWNAMAARRYCAALAPGAPGGGPAVALRGPR